MNTLLSKGNYQPIDQVFITKSLSALQDLSIIQEQYNKGDTDTFLNEIRDSIAATYLGYSHVNTEKHGFDARRTLSDGSYEYLEVKSASFDARTWGATFNDTNQDKADAFKENNVYLCLSLWRYASDPIFFAYGKNSNIGIFLEERMKGRPIGTRSTQSISLQNLTNEYGFTIYSVTKSPAELYNILQMKNGCRNIRFSSIKSINDINISE
jgi:hypothetical protein